MVGFWNFLRVLFLSFPQKKKKKNSENSAIPDMFGSHCPSPTPRQCLGQSRKSQITSPAIDLDFLAQEEIFHCCELFTAALVVHLRALSNLQFFHRSFFRVLSSAEIADPSLVAFCYLSDPDLWCSYLHDMGNSHLMYCAGFTAPCMIWCESPQHGSDSEQLIYIFTNSLKNSSGVELCFTTVWTSCPSWKIWFVS